MSERKTTLSGPEKFMYIGLILLGLTGLGRLVADPPNTGQWVLTLTLSVVLMGSLGWAGYLNKSGRITRTTFWVVFAVVMVIVGVLAFTLGGTVEG